MTAQPLAPPPGVIPSSETEEWEVRVDSKIVLKVLKATRFGQPIEELLTVGPRARGRRFLITTDDRKDNQRKMGSVDHDPFKNGMLLRVDEDQQAEPETASEAALSDEGYLEILDLDDAAFQTRVTGLSEVPIRNLRDMAEGAGASHTKVAWLDEHMRERFMPGGPQTSIADGGTAERMS
jgi:phosphatidate phosphatase APP1